MVYVWQGDGQWNITTHIDEATFFDSIEACNQHYLSKCAFPEDYEESTRNGFLKYTISYPTIKWDYIGVIENGASWPCQVFYMEENKGLEQKRKITEDILNSSISLGEIIEQFQEFSRELKKDAQKFQVDELKNIRLLQAKYFDTAIALLESRDCNSQPLQCQNCGNIFMAKSPMAKFCSDKCRVQHHRQSQKQVNSEQ